MIEVPIAVTVDKPSADVICDLAGRRYTITLRWNRRAAFWLMDLTTSSGSVVSGVAIHADRPLARVEGGMLLAWDTSGKHIDPALEELGARVKLYFLEPGDSA